MSLIMDALEKVQREKQVPALSGMAIEQTAGAAINPPEARGQFRESVFNVSPEAFDVPGKSRVNQIGYFLESVFLRSRDEQWLRWMKLGGLFFLTGSLTVFLFQQSSLRFIPLDVFVPHQSFEVSPPPERNGGTFSRGAERVLDESSVKGALRGIVQDESGAYCLIGERILKKGDTWQNYQVTAIGLKQVTLKNKEDRYLTLSLQD